MLSIILIGILFIISLIPKFTARNYFSWILYSFIIFSTCLIFTSIFYYLFTSEFKISTNRIKLLIKNKIK
jgi:hypothetical protein